MGAARMTQRSGPRGSRRGAPPLWPLTRNVPSDAAESTPRDPSKFSGWSQSFHEHHIASAMDVRETDAAIEIILEAPGMDASDFEIDAADGELVIRGDKKGEPEDGQAVYRLVERVYGAFARRVALPRGLDLGEITANLERGLLVIHIPKSGPAKTQSVAIIHG